MNEPLFNVGDEVRVPTDRIAPDKLKGAGGRVVEVLPGTGPGAQFLGPNERIEWSTNHQYIVDFGKRTGKERVDEAILTHTSN